LSENNKKEEEVLLTPEEVNYVLQFAQSLNGYGLYSNAISPLLLNKQLQNITLNPMQATEDSLATALNNPKDNELILQEFSQDFEIQSQVYKKLLSYLGTMLTFDMTYECINAKPSDYTGAKYAKDLDIFKKFVDNFNYKQEFSTIVQELLRNEAYFGCPRFDNDKLVFQELPSSPTYTTITGRWPYGFLFTFNMIWFLNVGVDINMYPSFFKRKFNELWGDKKHLDSYRPDIDPLLRGESSWIYHQDIPVDVGWVFKFNPAIASRVPYYAGLFLDLIQQPLMRALQKNVNMATAAKMVIGEIPLLNKTAQASTRDQFAISSKNLGEFLAIVKGAIGDSLKTAAVPLSNVQGIEFTAETSLYSDSLRTMLATSGVNTNLIFTSDVRPNSIESQLSLNVDEAQMTSLYPQFENFMNYQINKLTKNFKFKIHFQGTHFYNGRQQRIDNALSLANVGIVLPNEIAASIGMNPFEFQRQLEEAQANNWSSKLQPIISAFQQGNDAGRPQSPTSKIGDSGEETRSSGGNVDKGGKI